MKGSVLILHGYMGSPDSNWFPWLEQELTEREFAVKRPSLPDPDHPKQAAWLNTIARFVESAQEPIILVGHSLGGLAVLRYLETVPSKPIKAAMVVAAPTDWTIHATRHPGIKDFFTQGKLDYETIRSNVESIELFYSADDRYVDLEEGQALREATGAPWHQFTDRGHFNAEEGITQFAELRDLVLTSIQ